MYSILIVEDDLCTGRALGNLCRHDGYDVTVLTSGAAAAELVQRTLPDLIILDYMLPDMDGLEVLQHVRAKSRLVPVMIYTARDESEVREQFHLAGATDFWPKARISPEEILSSLSSHLRQHSVVVPPADEARIAPMLQI